MTHTKEIVVVDDETPQLLAVTAVLKDHGFSVAGFGTADEALTYIKDNPPVLVLSDFVLPNIDGLELVKRVKLFDANIECVLMTGHGNIEGVAEASPMGVREYLKKPFRSADLLAVVERAFHVKSLQQPLLGASMPEAATLKVKTDKLVDDFLARYVHKLNNAMLPFVFELDQHLENIKQFSDVDQKRLKALSSEIQAQMNAVKTTRALIGKQ
ncbi:response regulator [Limnobacter parvus]|uniref:Response regulator n=1 Tax=Limnobacter parvus TaxID=2939690 RepID=A0ABT1XHT1_9BURK|nr:response regulator [Limnobacter parvus]MCR2746835.1 response regulator [Limnobacter parvus]